MDDVNDVQDEKQSASNAATVDESCFRTDPIFSNSEAVSVVKGGNSSDDDPTTASDTSKSRASYDPLSYLKRFSRQERRRIEGEILKGRKPGEPMTTYNLTLATSNSELCELCGMACPHH